MPPPPAPNGTLSKQTIGRCPFFRGGGGGWDWNTWGKGALDLGNSVKKKKLPDKRGEKEPYSLNETQNHPTSPETIKWMKNPSHFKLKQFELTLMLLPLQVTVVPFSQFNIIELVIDNSEFYYGCN